MASLMKRPGQYHLRIVAVFGLIGKILRVYTDAVSANRPVETSGSSILVPALWHFVGIDVHFVEDDRVHSSGRC